MMDRPTAGVPDKEVQPSGGPPDSSLHDVILSEIRGHILSGRWLPGHRLPIETDLALHYNCSRMTVNKAMTQLVNTGLIERRKKAGSFVLAPRSQSAVLELHDIQDDVAAMGRPYRFALLRRKLRQSNAADLARLTLKQAVPVLAIEAMHFAGNAPYCHEDRLINLAEVPAAATQDFTTLAPGSWLIQHVPWTEAEHRIRAAIPVPKMAVALHIKSDQACLILERLTWRNTAPLTDVLLTYPAAMRELIARFTPP